MTKQEDKKTQKAQSDYEEYQEKYGGIDRYLLTPKESLDKLMTLCGKTRSMICDCSASIDPEIAKHKQHLWDLYVPIIMLPQYSSTKGPDDASLLSSLCYVVSLLKDVYGDKFQFSKDLNGGYKNTSGRIYSAGLSWANVNMVANKNQTLLGLMIKHNTKSLAGIEALYALLLNEIFYKKIGEDILSPIICGIRTMDDLSKNDDRPITVTKNAASGVLHLATGFLSSGSNKTSIPVIPD